MFCSFCGTVMSDGQKKCPVCGSINEAPVAAETPVEAPAVAPAEAPAAEAASLDFSGSFGSAPAVTMEEASPYANFAPDTNVYEEEYKRIVADPNAPKASDANTVLVLGIVAIAVAVAIGAPLPGLILAIIALKKAKAFKDYPNAEGASSAKIGKILATIALVVSIVTLSIIGALLLLYLLYIIFVIVLGFGMVGLFAV